jgi:hypothetical protein
MIKMTYLPNMIRIPTHRVGLWHPGLRRGERRPKSPMESPQGEERRRKKEREDEERERGASAIFYLGVTPNDMAQLFHESRHLTWHVWIDVARCHAPVP